MKHTRNVLLLLIITALAASIVVPGALATHTTQTCTDSFSPVVDGNKGVLGPAMGCSVSLPCPSVNLGGCNWRAEVTMTITGLAVGRFIHEDTGIRAECLGALTCTASRTIFTPAGVTDTLTCRADSFQIGALASSGLNGVLRCRGVAI